MAKRMTIVFDDEELYKQLRIEAVREGRHAKDIVSEAVREWLERQEDAELLPLIEAAEVESRRDGGIELSEFLRSLEPELKAE